MSEFKGTPGPWFSGDYGGVDGVGRFVGGLPAPDGCIYICDIKGRSDEHLANARLIAAAPELLEALQLCEEFMSLLPSTGFDGLARIEGARAAITKALGASDNEL